MTSLTHSQSPSALQSATTAQTNNSSSFVDTNNASDQLFDSSESFAKGIKSKLKQQNGSALGTSSGIENFGLPSEDVPSANNDQTLTNDTKDADNNTAAGASISNDDNTVTNEDPLDALLNEPTIPPHASSINGQSSSSYYNAIAQRNSLHSRVDSQSSFKTATDDSSQHSSVGQHAEINEKQTPSIGNPAVLPDDKPHTVANPSDPAENQDTQKINHTPFENPADNTHSNDEEATNTTPTRMGNSAASKRPMLGSPPAIVSTAATTVTTTATYATGTLSHSENKIKDKVADIVDSNNTNQPSNSSPTKAASSNAEFNEDFNESAPPTQPKVQSTSDNSQTANEPKPKIQQQTEQKPVASKTSNVNLQPVAKSTDAPLKRSNTKRRSIFGFASKTNNSSNSNSVGLGSDYARNNHSSRSIGAISGPVPISEADSSSVNAEDSKLKIPKALQQVQQQQKELYGNIPKNYIPTQNQQNIAKVANNNKPLQQQQQQSQQNQNVPKYSTFPTRKSSRGSLFEQASFSSNQSSPDSKLKKSKSSLKSFFKYRKSVSSNNLNQYVDGRAPTQNKTTSNLDLHSAYRNDSFSISSVDNRSLSSNATTKTSISTFKKNVFNKLKSKGSGGSGGSLFRFRKSSNSSRTPVDNSDQVSVRTSNTINFQYAISNMVIKEEAENINQTHGSPRSVSKSSSIQGRDNSHDAASPVKTPNRSNLTTPKRPTNSSLYSPNTIGDSTIKRNTNNNTPSSHSKKSSLSNTNTNNAVSSDSKTTQSHKSSLSESSGNIQNTTTSVATPSANAASATTANTASSSACEPETPAAPEISILQPNESVEQDVSDNFDEGDVLFPKSLDIKEVKSIVSIERKLSTRSVNKRGDSVRRQNRASLEVKAKEDGMTVEFGKDVNEPPIGLKKTNSILKKKQSVDGPIHEGEELNSNKAQQQNQQFSINRQSVGSGISSNNKLSPTKKSHTSPSKKSHRSSVASSITDFGISFSDTNLDLDFPEFHNDSAFLNDDVSSRSFESNDDTQGINAVSKSQNRLINTGEKSQNAVSATANGIHGIGANASVSYNQSNATTDINNGHDNKINDKPTGKFNTGKGFINSLVKGRYNKGNNNSITEKQDNEPSTNANTSMDDHTTEHENTYVEDNEPALEPPIIEITSSKNINYRKYGHSQKPSTSSTFSNNSVHSNQYQGTQPQHQHTHKRNNLSSSSFLPVSTSLNSLNNSNDNGSMANRRAKNASFSSFNGGHTGVKFSSRIILYETYNAEDYDRHPEIATCNQLTPMLAQQIKEELNTFKAEMPIHEESKSNTHFF